MSLSKEEIEMLIKEHARIKIKEIKVLRRMHLSYNDCCHEPTIRQFCADNKVTLPESIEVEVIQLEDELNEWHINIYEQPNLRDTV